MPIVYKHAGSTHMACLCRIVNFTYLVVMDATVQVVARAMEVQRQVLLLRQGAHLRVQVHQIINKR